MLYNKQKLWHWKAFDSTGSLQEDFDLAADRKALQIYLAAKQLILCDYQIEKAHQLRNARNQLIYLLTQLAGLLQAQMPLIQAITILLTNAGDSAQRYFWLTVYCQIKQGHRLANALAQAKLFYYIPLASSMLAFGEESGQTIIILEQLVDLLKTQNYLKQRLLNPLRYPLLVLTFAILIFIAMLWWLVPVFDQLFHDKQQLPWLTQTVFWASQQIHQPKIFIGMPMVIILFFFISWRWHNQFIRHFPIINQLQRLNNLISTLTLLASSEQAKMPLLTVLAQLQSHHSLFTSIHQSLVNGTSLSAALEKTKQFPSFVFSLIAQGEQSGELAAALSQAVNFLKQQLENYIEQLTLWLEPLLMLLLSALISLIVIALYLPIFDLSQTL